MMKFAVVQIGQVPLRDGQRVGCRIHAVQSANSLGNVACPSTAATANVRAFGILPQTVPWKDIKISVEDRLVISAGHFALIKARPFATELSYYGNIGVC